MRVYQCQIVKKPVNAFVRSVGPAATPSRMLKKSASFVLASRRGSTYDTQYDFASSLAAALLGGLFEHPAGVFSPCHRHETCSPSKFYCAKWFFAAC